MTTPIKPELLATDLDKLVEVSGSVVVFVAPNGAMDLAARRVNRLTNGSLKRLVESDKFSQMKDGDAVAISFPGKMAADSVVIVRLGKRPSVGEARKAGVSIGKAKGDSAAVICAGSLRHVGEMALGVMLRCYDFTDHKSAETAAPGGITFMVNSPEDTQADIDGAMAVAEGVFFTRDLVNDPANVLTTTEFADRLAAMKDIGLKVTVIEEKELEKLGMRTLLSVGHGSDSPSKVVVMEWNGGKKGDAPFAFVGKGVVFDTGGISIKPAAGMEDMTMDMGGAGVVSGVMKTLALRKAKANVVGIVGLVENMPSGRATRPGDIIKSMKGDTVEIINTDAEGRLVLADCLWYAQEKYAPVGMINLATLTGAIIIGLGHEKAGVFSNSDQLSNTFLRAAVAEEEGAWRMPLDPAYDALLKSRIADMKNVGGRAAGSITAAQFLQRFVKDETQWAHLDIAGVTLGKSETAFAPKGATGWGVRALNRLIADNYEAE